jgi:hydrogenase large subunit
MFVTPGVVVDGKLVTNDLVEINLGIRILLGHSFYDDWEDQEMFVTHDPWATRSTGATRGTSTPSRSRRSATSTTSTAGSCRPAGSTARTTWRSTPAAAPSPGCGRPRWPAWSTPATSRPPAQRADQPAPKTALRGPVDLPGVEGPAVVQHDRAEPGPTYFQAYAAAARCTSSSRRSPRSGPARTKTWEPFEVPEDAIGCGFTEAVRGVLSHHMVIRDGKIANYHPYPPTPWNANPRDSYGTPGPYEDAVQDTPIFEENPPENFKGIDIMRAVRSFDPCLPCGVHMYLGKGKVLKKMHSPVTNGAGPRLLDKLVADPLVESLLLVHDLHPLEVGARIQRAIDQVLPQFGSHAGKVDFAGIDDQGVIHLRMEAAGHGCGSSPDAVRAAVEEAVTAAAPETAGLDIEVVEAPAELPLLQIGRRPAGLQGAR